MADYAFHEVATLFPLMEEDGLDALAQDIKEKGLEIPIELFEGKIIDGRNRQTACLMAGVEPDYIEVDPDDPVAYVISMNLKRRHLSTLERGQVADRTREFYDKQAKERQRQSKGRGKTKGPDSGPDLNSGDARDKAGDLVGVSGRNVDRVAKVRKQGSKKLQAAVDNETVAVSTAAKLAELPKAEQDKALAGGKQAIKTAVTPQTPKSPYPVFEHFLDMLNDITFFMGKIEEDYESLTGFVNHKDWNPKRTPEAAGFLRAVTEGIVEFNQEMETLCPPKQ